MKKSAFTIRLRSCHLFLLVCCSLYACKKTNSNIVSSSDSSSVSIPAVTYDTSFEIGGSNYPMYSVGTYLEYPTDSDWFAPLNLRPVIGTYHLAPDTVRKQLAIMYANGQRKIALDLWYLDFSLYGSPSDNPLNGHIVNSKLGKLMPQQESNLKSLLNDIENAGFNFVILRFATQGDSAPIGWASWDQSKYDKNWSFVKSTIETVRAQIAGKSLRVIFDLELEIGGVTNGQAVTYCNLMWKDYVKSFGSHNSIGFSISYSYPYSPKIATAMQSFDQAAVRPDIYGFDIYGDEYNSLAKFKSELDGVGEGKKPVFIEEAFYNDEEAHQEIMQARQTLQMNIKWIMQWPEQRGAYQNNFSVQFPADYSNYLN
jgi:hypothetical protein